MKIHFLMILGVLVALLIVAAVGSVASKKTIPLPPTFSEVVDEVQHSTCQIIVAMPRNGILIPPSDAEVGSCFFVNADGYLLTNAHVVKAAQQRSTGGFGMYIYWPLFDTTEKAMNVAGGRPPMVGWTYSTVKLIDMDETADVALLQANVGANSKIQPHFLKLRFQPAPVGFNVAITGYPLFEDNPVTLRSIVASQKKVHPSDFDTRNQLAPAVPYYLLDRAMIHGISGSPVYSAQNGDVIAIAERFKVDTVQDGSQNVSVFAALGQAIGLTEARQLMRNHNVSFTTSGPED